MDLPHTISAYGVLRTRKHWHSNPGLFSSTWATEARTCRGTLLDVSTVLVSLPLPFCTRIAARLKHTEHTGSSPVNMRVLSRAVASRYTASALRQVDDATFFRGFVGTSARASPQWDLRGHLDPHLDCKNAPTAAPGPCADARRRIRAHSFNALARRSSPGSWARSSLTCPTRPFFALHVRDSLPAGSRVTYLGTDMMFWSCS